MNTILLAGIVAIVGVAVTVASLVYLHVVPTGLSPIRNAVSEYGISPYRRWYRVATIALGIAGLATAVSLHTALVGTLRAVVLLIVFGAARLVISWSPMDAIGSPRTRHGRLHNLLAIAAFGSATAAGFLAAGPIASDSQWSAYSLAAAIFTWIMAAGGLGVILSVRLAPIRRYFGALERTIYVGIIGWITVLAIASVSAGQ
jgi:hypothetical protein